MPKRGGKRFVILSGAEEAMESFRMEVLKDLGLYEKYREGGWDALEPQETGKIGGVMVRRIMLIGELELLKRFNDGKFELTPEVIKKYEKGEIILPDNLEDL